MTPEIELMKKQQADLKKALDMAQEWKAIAEKQAAIIKDFRQKEEVLMERINSEPERFRKHSDDLLRSFKAGMDKAYLLVFTNRQHYEVLRYFLEHWHKEKNISKLTTRAAKYFKKERRSIEIVLQQLREFTRSETNELAFEKYEQLGIIFPETRFLPPS